MNYKNKNCLDCNLSFKPKSSINVYCDDCYKERCKQTCEFCGKVFYKPNPAAPRKSCGSKECVVKAIEILIKKGVPKEITIYNDRSVVKSAYKGMMELDVFIPSLNIAIEFNGRYRHPDKEYYSGLNKEDWKTLQCKKSNIKLYHIWDDENIEDRINSIKEIQDFIKRGENG